MKTAALLAIVSLICFVLAGCSTPAQTSAVVAAVGASAVELIHQLSPLIPPEKLAALQATAHNIDGTVGAVQTAVGTIADVIAAFKGSVGAQFQTHADALSKATTTIAALPSREEVQFTNAGYSTAALAASRGLSMLKHAKKAA